MKNVRVSSALIVLFGAVFSLFGQAATPASAQTLAPQERLCDPTFQDCRADVLTYINQETVEIDMGFWMMTDGRYAQALVNAWSRGVKIRLLMDPRCVDSHEKCGPQNDQLQAAGIPMRKRLPSGILHWKVAIFAGQGQIEFAGANYAPFEMTPDQPWVNFTDEIVYFTNNTSLVHSFMRKFDDLWISTDEFGTYANITAPLTRSYPLYSIDPQLNFPPDDSYRSRSIAAYQAETQAIDVLMFRITDERQSDAMIAAINRGLPVRLITDEVEYRNVNRLWDSYNVDKMYAAGVQVRLDAHQGINHEKAILLRGSGMTIFGSSNWTSPSTDSQREHNMFSTQPWMFTWLDNQFTRKWTNGSGFAETKPFVPQPPDQPVNNLPANLGTDVPTTGVSLSWFAGLWAHRYDIYFGTTPTPPLLEANRYLGPSQWTGDYRYYALPTLQPGTRYYWKIVSKTMANVTAEGPTWSFTTAGTAPNNVPPTVSLTSPAAGATFSAPATITLTANAADSDGTVTRVDFYQGTTLIGSATTAPYSVSWTGVPAGSYVLKAVATDNGNATTTSATVSIAVNSGPAPVLPSGWSHGDIGATGVAGDATFSNGVFSVSGAGADVWGTADALHYAYRTLTGDGTIVARVTSIQNVAAWTKVGVMIRNSTDASSAQGFMLVAASAAKGVPFQRRPVDGGGSFSSPGSQSTAPRWVKLVRAGNVVTGSESPDGLTWTVVGTDTFTMGNTVLIGLGVSSHIAGTNATATFDNVTVTTANPANVPPTVTLTSPTAGAATNAPGSFTLTANASDSDGTIAKVDFYAGSSLLGTATAAPYSRTWTNVAPGTYTITAVATDNGGATATSAAVSVTVTSPANTPPSVAITAPASGTTLTAPASVTLTASASDSDGTVTKVDYYAGSTLLGTATASPYSVPWNNIPAGSYSLTAVATDNGGATRTSATVTLTVNTATPPPSLPAGWAHADIGTVGFAGDASVANGTFTVQGSGADVWGTEDAFHYAYTPLSGDATIIARVTSVQSGVASWVKAGVMIRESLTPGSAHGFMLVSSAKGIAFQRRPTAGGLSVNTAGTMSTAPRWVKLQRTGSLFSAYESADGVTWTLVGTEQIPMGTTVFAGLVVSSHTNAALATCTFDNVSIR